MDEMTYIVCRIITMIVVLIIAYYTVPLLKNALGNIKDERLSRFIQSAVNAAQQLYEEGIVKREYVIKQTKEWLETHKIKITESQLSLLIEDAVHIMKNQIQ